MLSNLCYNVRNNNTHKTLTTLERTIANIYYTSIGWNYTVLAAKNQHLILRINHTIIDTVENLIVLRHNDT